MIKTNINKTKQALNGYFQTVENGNLKINETYLNDSVYLLLMNTERLYLKLKNKRIKITSIIWETFTMLTNEILNNEYYPEIYNCTSQQLKAWLKDYNLNYEIFNNLVLQLEEERNELLKGVL
jgi:hypothetical protein